jgi:long-subunit fatty acid transport protein
MKSLSILLCVLIASVAISAQDLGILEENTAGNFFGFGARQMSMGGAGIASSLDGAALYYNPAALARIHKIEIQFGLTHQKFRDKTTQPPNRYDGFTSILNSSQIDQTKTRFGSLNLTIPVPTYRGSLAVAFGINRIMSFDRSTLLHVVDQGSGGGGITDYAEEFETGGIYLYSGGAGFDISPNLSLGLSLNVYSGKDDYRYNYVYTDNAVQMINASGANRVTEDYIGVSAKGGLLARPNEHLSFGLTIESPMDFQVDYTFSNTSDYFEHVKYDLTRPFIFGGGVAVRSGMFLAAADAEYIDWSQLSYNDNPDQSAYNDRLAQLYREVLNLRGGIEYQIPNAGLALRAGAFLNPLPYRKEGVVYSKEVSGTDTLFIPQATKFIDKDRKGFSVGFGWLIDDVLMLEAAYVRGTFTHMYPETYVEDAVPVNPASLMATAEDTFNRVYVTMSYRY